MVLIAVSALGLSVTFIWSAGTKVVNQRQVQAADFTKETLEELLMKDYNDTDLDLGNHTTEAFLALPSCSLKDNFSGSRFYNVASMTEGKQINVTLSWTEDSQAKNETLYGLVIQR